MMVTMTIDNPRPADDPNHILNHLLSQLPAAADSDEVCVTTDAAGLADRVFRDLQAQAQANGGYAFSHWDNHAGDVVLDGSFDLTRAVRAGLGLPPNN